MRIGILTGGGDVPGLNPCIKAVVNRVAEQGHEVVGIRRGWAGVLEHNPDDPESAARHFLDLTPNVVRTIDRTGGTMLHTSRTNPQPSTHSSLLKGCDPGCRCVSSSRRPSVFEWLRMVMNMYWLLWSLRTSLSFQFHKRHAARCHPGR